MTDAGGPPRRALCFLSTLLSQKVPEKSDAVLRCMISGQPKPEVTWYKNGQAMEHHDSISSYEFFEHQYIHVLHLYCCTKSDAAIYQISAKNCLGMICCSASIEVERPVECLPLPPDLGDDKDTGWKREAETNKEESTNPTDEKEPPYKEGDSISLGACKSADASPAKFDRLHAPQLLANSDTSASSSENPPDSKATRPTAEAYDPDNREEISLNSNQIPHKEDVGCHRTVQSTVSGPGDGGLSNGGPDDEIASSSHQNPKAQKYISFSLPLSEATAHIYPGDSGSVSKQPGPQGSSEDSDSDYELCPEITLTCTEEFSDDDLEYLECSDVMTDYSNAIWQRSLQGTEHVFLLESDDEEPEFGDCGLGGCELFLSEMGCGPWVSGDTGPMDATTGFCGYHSQAPEVGLRSSGASRHSPLSPQTGMTLTLGPHQDETAMVSGQRRCPLPAASEAAENDCPGIPGETRDSHQVGEEFASDNLLTMDKAVTETEVKPFSGGLEKSGMKQSSETTVEGRGEIKDLGDRRGTQKPARVRRLGTKGRAKKLTPRESAAEGPLNPPPTEPAKHPLTRSHQRTAPHVEAAAPGQNSHFHTGECAISIQTEQDAKTLQPSADLLPKEGYPSSAGEGMPAVDLFETSQVPDHSDHLQGQIQEPAGERSSLSPVPAFPEPAGEESSFTGTTTNFFSNSGETYKENALLVQYLEGESHTQGPQQDEKQGREGDTPGHLCTDLECEPSVPEANDGTMSPVALSAHLDQDTRMDSEELEPFSVSSPETKDTALTLENVCRGSRDRAAAPVMECFEVSGQGACYDTMDSPVGAPVDKYLPQEVYSTDFELTEGQSKVCDLFSLDDKTLAALLQTRGPEPPQSTYGSSEDRSSAVSPLSISPVTWSMSQEASKGGHTGGNLAKGDNCTSIVQAGWERPSLNGSGGCAEAHLFSSEDSSLVHSKERDDQSPRTGLPIPTDPPASHSPILQPPQEKPAALSAPVPCPQVTRETKDTSKVAVATQVHPAKYQATSVSEDSPAEGAVQWSLEAPGGHIFQFPSNVQLGQNLSSSSTESTKELPGPASSVLKVHGHVPPPPEQEGFCSHLPLQTDSQSRAQSQPLDGVDNGSLRESFQEKGSETKQRIWRESLPCQGSLSGHDFQESLPPTFAAQEEAIAEPLGHSPENSREAREGSSDLGTSVSLVAEVIVQEDSQVLRSVPALPEILLGESEQTGPGNWEGDNKLKIITLEASISEVWPPSQVTDSEYEEVEAGSIVPDWACALSEVQKANAAVPSPEALETAASAHRPQVEMSPALAGDPETREGQAPASSADQSSLSSQDANQPRLLESSVDPVDEMELCVPGPLSEASETGEKENINNTRQDQEENQIQVDHPAFLNQFLTFSNILESSVDPIDEAGVMECPGLEKAEPLEATLGAIGEGSQLNDGNSGQCMEVQPTIVQAPGSQDSGDTIPKGNRVNQDQVEGERDEAKESQPSDAKVGASPAIYQVLGPEGGRQGIPHACSGNQVPDYSGRSLGEAGRREKDQAELVRPTSPLFGCLITTTCAPVGVETHNSTGQIHGGPENDFANVFSDSQETATMENECGKRVPSSSDRTHLPRAASPERNITHFPRSPRIGELKIEEPQIGEAGPPSLTGSPHMTLAFISGEGESEEAPEFRQDPQQKRSILGWGKRPGEKEKSSYVATPSGKLPGARPVARSEEVKKKQETPGSGHLAEGVKKKILSRVAALRLRLEEKENVRKNSSLFKKIPKLEKSLSRTEEKKDLKKVPCRREGTAPVLLKKIQAEMFPDHSGNVRLTCQFAEIHEDSTIWWTKDSESIAQVQRSAGDNSAVSLAIIQASQKDQGLYCCRIDNSYGNVAAEFHLTPEVLRQLSSHRDAKGCEEIEFSQLIFKEDFLNDSYFGGRLRGQIATEELHFGEGVHRKAFRSTVMQGLMPVFQPGHACVLKVHNAVAHGTRNNDELIQRNYKLAAQECYVQNTARHYAKIYAAEAQPLEGFGEVPEIIPIFLIHRPENNIPYATVEEELIGEFVKYSIRDGKEVNFLRRESEAGQKCCTFQHWVYQKTSGCLLVTDMQGVGMKLTDVGIATLAKGYKGFKGNCSISFIDQFKALHQCNKYCKMLGLKSLQTNNQKPKKPTIGKSKVQTNSTTVKKSESGTPAEKKS